MGQPILIPNQHVQLVRDHIAKLADEHPQLVATLHQQLSDQDWEFFQRAMCYNLDRETEMQVGEPEIWDWTIHDHFYNLLMRVHRLIRATERRMPSTLLMFVHDSICERLNTVKFILKYKLEHLETEVDNDKEDDTTQK